MTNSPERSMLASAGHYADGVVELFRLREALEAKARALLANRARLEARSWPGMTSDDPTEAGLRAEIRVLGERIDALGGTGAMVDIWDELHRTAGPHASTAVDHAWHGVGRWAA
ncbi:hypothetical protein [Azospirillum doebereinerae]|uniref:Uncharacterized protein n=1 Tax=Azospirillum doebereinerae TaxID=92933 RepID=A0A3S0VEZ0_9PROT|nr:hypothetical protein [Azospirillum doebereinerae]RUQ65173.1 hypothetical protein EJ913_25855 [Azospirillum doebereinerae]